jgi:hypothetical protein
MKYSYKNSLKINFLFLAFFLLCSISAYLSTRIAGSISSAFYSILSIAILVLNIGMPILFKKHGLNQDQVFEGKHDIEDERDEQIRYKALNEIHSYRLYAFTLVILPILAGYIVKPSDFVALFCLMFALQEVAYIFLYHQYKYNGSKIEVEK